MKRYEHYGTLDGGGPAEAIEEADGEWVRHEDALAAVAAERARWIEAVLAELDGNGQAMAILAYATRA